MMSIQTVNRNYLPNLLPVKGFCVFKRRLVKPDCIKLCKQSFRFKIYESWPGSAPTDQTAAPSDQTAAPSHQAAAPSDQAAAPSARVTPSTAASVHKLPSCRLRQHACVASCHCTASFMHGCSTTENNGENGSVTLPAVTAEPLTAAIVVKWQQRRQTVTLARNDGNVVLLSSWQSTSELGTEYKWEKLLKPAQKYQKPAFYHLTSRAGLALEKKVAQKVVSMMSKWVGFHFWLHFNKPEYIPVHHESWWSGTRYICSFSWTHEIKWPTGSFVQSVVTSTSFVSSSFTGGLNYFFLFFTATLQSLNCINCIYNSDLWSMVVICSDMTKSTMKAGLLETEAHQMTNEQSTSKVHPKYTTLADIYC